MANVKLQLIDLGSDPIPHKGIATRQKTHPARATARPSYTCPSPLSKGVTGGHVATPEHPPVGTSLAVQAARRANWPVVTNSSVYDSIAWHDDVTTAPPAAASHHHATKCHFRDVAFMVFFRVMIMRLSIICVTVLGRVIGDKWGYRSIKQAVFKINENKS